MAVEAKRGCGYRKVGGLYMVSGKLAADCGRLPMELHVCPVCNAGVKQTRGWTWVNPSQLLAAADECALAEGRYFTSGIVPCIGCMANPANLSNIVRAGLLWVGGSFYPDAWDFMQEAREMGVSRRISAVPRGFKVGEHWVLIAHPKAIYREPVNEDEVAELRAINAALIEDQEDTQNELVRAGVITLFKPTAIEKIVTATQAQDADAMEELRVRGITPVAVPDDDPDHQGTVYDMPPEQGRIPLVPPANGAQVNA
jgi:hypothetical protein